MAAKGTRELMKAERPGYLAPFEEMEKWFEETWRRPFSLLRSSMWPKTELEEFETVVPYVDIFEDGNELVMRADLPGMKKEDVDINLTENVLTVSGQKKKEEKVEKGNYFRYERSGLSSVVSDCPYLATAETVSACQVSFIPRLEFLRFLRSNSDVSMRVAKHLSMELHEAWRQSRMVALAPDTHAKLAQFLIDQAGKHGQVTDGGLRIALHMTHEEIAENIGASRESVSRIMKELRTRGVIGVNGGMITIFHAIELSNLMTPS